MCHLGSDPDSYPYVREPVEWTLDTNWRSERQTHSRSRSEGIIRSEPLWFGVWVHLEMVLHCIFRWPMQYLDYEDVSHRLSHLEMRWLNASGNSSGVIGSTDCVDMQSSVSQAIERLYCDTKMRLCLKCQRAQSGHQKIPVYVQVWIPVATPPADVTRSFDSLVNCLIGHGFALLLWYISLTHTAFIPSCYCGLWNRKCIPSFHSYETLSPHLPFYCLFLPHTAPSNPPPPLTLMVSSSPADTTQHLFIFQL